LPVNNFSSEFRIGLLQFTRSNQSGKLPADVGIRFLIGIKSN
jgi:hypothetical protein